MPHDVFISYSAKDKPVADAACATLENKGIRCWIGPRDIVPGMDWGEAIIDAISAARVMVLVFSSHADGSHQVKREVERAVSKGIPIIPVRIEAVAPSKSMEYFISSPHWLDALTPPLERHLDSLASMVKLLLDRLGQQPQVRPEGQPVTELPSELPRPVAEPSPEMRAAKAAEVALHAPESEPLATRGAEPPPPPETPRKFRPPVRIYVAASLVLLGVAVVLLMLVRRDGPIEAPANSGTRVEKDTFEPNNDFQAATPLKLGAWIWMSIFPKADTDFFRIDPPDTGYIVLRVEEVPAAVHLVYQFFNEKRQPLGNGSIVRVTEEPVYLSVRDDRDDGEDAQTLALSASWLPERDTGEPNNDAKRATPIQLEQRHTMAILPAGDEDWFKFDIKETGYVFPAVEDVPAELVLAFECFDEKGGASRGRGRSWRLDPGTHTLRVADGHVLNRDSVSSLLSFPFSLSFLKEMDLGEPNNDARRATPIQLEQQHTMAILPVGDQDWFRFEVTETGYVLVDVEDVPSGVTLQYECFDEKGSVSRGHGRSCRVDPGTYTLRVADSSIRPNLVDRTSTSASPIPFPFSLSFLKEMDPGEPNGDARRATPLELGKATRLAILPTGDQDYFRVELPAAGAFHVEAIDVPQVLGIEFRLFEGDHDLGAGPNWAIPKKGVYLLRVGDNFNDAGSPTPFLIEGTFTAK